MSRVYRIVVTRYDGEEHATKRSAQAALKKLKLRKGELAVLIEQEKKR